MKVKDICNTDVVTVTTQATIGEAARIMREHHVGDVIVVEAAISGCYPRGIVTDRDLVVGVLAQDISDIRAIMVADIMGRDLITANVDEDILDVVTRMQRFGVRRLPVINSVEVLVGIVTYDDIVHALAKRLAELARVSPRQMEFERTRRL